jgi:hypothetical protein
VTWLLLATVKQELFGLGHRETPQLG